MITKPIPERVTSSRPVNKWDDDSPAFFFFFFFVFIVLYADPWSALCILLFPSGLIRGLKIGNEFND